jgi:hypothetical protein
MNRAEIGLKVTPPSPHSRPIALRRNYDVLRHITRGVIGRGAVGDRKFQEPGGREHLARGEQSKVTSLDPQCGAQATALDESGSHAWGPGGTSWNVPRGAGR